MVFSYSRRRRSVKSEITKNISLGEEESGNAVETTKEANKELAPTRWSCEGEKMDKISDLPDDILVSIISRLTPKEARATGILSTRWRHLYTSVTCLRFCYPEQQITRIRRKNPKKSQEKEFLDYIKSVDGVLDSFRDIRNLKEFRVDLPSLMGVNMKKWLRFALERKVESIGIHMMTCYKNRSKDHGAMRRGGYHNFPDSILKKNTELNSVLVPGVESLKELSLQGVHVKDKDVELFISSLSKLESLTVSCSSKLKKVRVFGHSKLKKLDISSCPKVELVEVRDMNNLVSLRCDELGFENMLELRLDSIPNLTHFEISDRPEQSFIDIWPTIPSCICNQLLHLKLSTDPDFVLLSGLEDRKFDVFNNLKHVDMDIFCYTTKLPIKRIIHLITACPRLEKIEIKFVRCTPGARGSTLFEDTTSSPLDRVASPIFYSKRIKFQRHLGSWHEIEFAFSSRKLWESKLSDFESNKDEQWDILFPTREPDLLLDY